MKKILTPIWVVFLASGCHHTANDDWTEIESETSILNNAGQVYEQTVTRLKKPSYQYVVQEKPARKQVDFLDGYQLQEQHLSTQSGVQSTQKLYKKISGDSPFEEVIAISDLSSQSEANAVHFVLPHRFIVSLKQQPQALSLSALSSKYGFKPRKELGDKLTLLVEKKVTNLKERARWLDNIQSSGDVKWVEADAIVFADVTPNDTDFNRLWGLHNTGQTGGTADADIDAIEAWDLSTGNQSVAIGVVDTGVDYGHVDLKDNIWNNPGEMGLDNNGLPKQSNGIDDDNNGYIDDWRGWDFANDDNDPMDDHYHGTHVAGTIAAMGNNNQGIVGVGWSFKIVPLKFLRNTGSGSTSDAIEALNYATQNGIPITNNSWGGGGFSQIMEDALKRNAAANSVFIASAGNSGRDNDKFAHYPSNYKVDNLISVAASDSRDKLASFSNYGAQSVHIAAPGVQIYSTRPGTPGYTYLNGTSMAAPHVAGVAGLILSQSPGISYRTVKAKILRGAERKSGLIGKVATDARLNAYLSMIPRTSNEVPVGSVTAFSGEAYDIPDNWMLCNGDEVKDIASPLYGKKVPDLRDRFVSGASDNTPLNMQGGRNQTLPHSHFSRLSSNRVWFGIKSGNGYKDAYNPASRAQGFHRHRVNLGAAKGASNPYDSHGHLNGSVTVSGHSQTGGVQDNRPAFVSLHYIIRIK